MVFKKFWIQPDLSVQTPLEYTSPPSSGHDGKCCGADRESGYRCNIQNTIFSNVFSPNEISAWILLQSYQVAAFILAEALHCRQNQLFCALLSCRLGSACCRGSRWFWAQLAWVPLTWEVRPAPAASRSSDRKWLLLCPSGAGLHGT